MEEVQIKLLAPVKVLNMHLCVKVSEVDTSDIPETRVVTFPSTLRDSSLCSALPNDTFNKLFFSFFKAIHF